MGDQSAAVTFTRRYQRRVFGLAYSMTNDASVAEEVAQEALIRVWRHAPVFDQHTLLGPVGHRSDPPPRRGVATLSDRDRHLSSRRIPPRGRGRNRVTGVDGRSAEMIRRRQAESRRSELMHITRRPLQELREA